MRCKFCKGKGYGVIDGKEYECKSEKHIKYFSAKKMERLRKSYKEFNAAKEFYKKFMDAINKIEEVKNE